ncbi:hypothetical protein JKG68_14265 [Microvirga aerilata]|uniref:Uncharacterized protein n=1 Tax=Microvirga aerilata TaxID=670292 RepID=A0A937CXB0_9HYPH|nr:hypothetical protein [Microvirga aerilata]MBL0405133.1 hypothetical protein [Microvirga aerilata]
MRALEEPEPEDRLATLPDFFVEEVRLDAAAARFVVDLDAPRDLDAEPLEAEPLDAELLAEDFTAPRLELRDADALPVERDEPERAEVERDEDFLAADEVDLAEVFLAGVFVAAVFLAVVFLAAVLLPPDLADDLADDLAEDFAADLVEVFLAAVDLAVVFLAPDLAEDFEVDFAAVFLAAVFVPDFFAAVLFEPDFAALERDEEPEDFAAVLVPDFAAPDFVAPDFAEDLEPFAVLDELLRELLFFAVFLVLVAPVSPVNNCVSGFDLMSIGIAASFKSLRVQPSRLQGNVVIPTRFRISESVDSRARTFSVDILIEGMLFTCRPETRYRVQDERVRASSGG